MLKNRDQKAIQKRLQDQMQIFGLDAMILSSPDCMYYATGWADPYSYYSHRTGFALAVVLPEGDCHLICQEMEVQAVIKQCKDIQIHPFPSFMYVDAIGSDESEKPAQPNENLTFDIAAEIVLSCNPNAIVGMEINSLPHPRFLHVQKLFGKKLVDCIPAMRKAREIKTPYEIDLLRRAAKSCENAMHEACLRARIGMTQRDVFNVYREACFHYDPEVDDWQNSPCFGTSYSVVEIPMDDDVRLKSGDIVRLDSGPCIHKYASDLARTVAVGDPKPEQIKLYEDLYRGFSVGINMVGPGVRMCDVYNRMLEEFRKMGYQKYRRGHFGHSIGCSIHFAEEYPFISAHTTDVFQPGMVFSLETPYYKEFVGAINIEDSFLITENGIDRFTHAPETIFWDRNGSY